MATDLGVTVLTAGFAWVAMIAGIFGMNLSPYPQSHGYLVGVLVISGLTGGAIVVSILAWIRHRGLMYVRAPQAQGRAPLQRSLHCMRHSTAAPHDLRCPNSTAGSSPLCDPHAATLRLHAVPAAMYITLR